MKFQVGVYDWAFQVDGPPHAEHFVRRRRLALSLFLFTIRGIYNSVGTQFVSQYPECADGNEEARVA
jgi:hypothetical protein